MSTSRKRHRVVPTIFSMLVVVAPLVAEEAREVFVVNLPQVQQIEGGVRLTAPAPQTELVSLQEVIVSPVDPSDTTGLIAGGTLDTSGFVAVVLSLGGQVKADFFREGTIGAVLVPDERLVREAFDEAGRVLFPLRVEASASPGDGPYFASEHPSQQLGFPRYRVYFYNTTDRPASVTLWAYLAN